MVVTLRRKSRWIMVMMIGTLILFYVFTTIWMNSGERPKADGTYQYVVILGAKVKGTVPSLALRNRLQAAYDYSIQYPNTTFVLSGGQGPGEDITEAEAMKRYLMDKGVAESRLILENRSTSTDENIAFSKKLLPSDIKGITIVSNDFHLARAKSIAKKHGLEADVIAAPTPAIVEFRLRLRERLALTWQVMKYFTS